MKKIKVYIVTYKRNDVLNELLENIFTSNTVNYNLEINIINNHSDFYIEDKYKDQVKVHHNQCRVDWSNGNLAADFNFAILDGFRDLNNPDCDYVITLQNDALLHPNWCECIDKQLQKFDFVVGYLGDNIVGYTPEIIKNVGLWDENFSGVQNKEADFYLRSLIHHNPEKIQINDILHRRLINYDPALTLDLVENRGFIINQHNTSRFPDNEEHKEIRINMNSHRNQGKHYFMWKWEGTKPSLQMKGGSWEEPGWLINWPTDMKENPPSLPKVTQHIKYPFFEKDVINIADKGYITDGNIIDNPGREFTIKEVTHR